MPVGWAIKELLMLGLAWICGLGRKEEDENE